MPELTELPILKIVDTGKSFFECIILPGREIPDIISALVG